MKILFEQKKPGRVRQTVEPIEIEVEGTPATTAGLIESTVRAMVAAFNRKAADAPTDIDADNNRRVLSDSRIADLAETGRVAFGIVYNGRQVDPDEAVANALQCYEDGLFRVFLNGKDTGTGDTALSLREGDLVTVVRLTLLAGRMW